MKIIAITPDRKTDYLAETVIDGLQQLNVEIIASGLGNGINKIYSDDEIIKHSKDADYIFVIWGKVRNNFPPKYYLLNKINRPKVTIYIDGSEWTCTGYPNPGQLHQAQILKNETFRKGEPWINEEIFKYCKHYFKRECYKEDLGRGIKPLLFGALKRFFREDLQDKKTIDLFCAFGQEKDGLRKDAIAISKKLKNEGYNVVIANNLPYEEYNKILHSSRITIDAWGGGDCCQRLWENMAAKTCCAIQEYNIVFPDDFTDMKNAIKYKTAKELETKIRIALNNSDLCNSITINGYNHLLKYHTSKKRVEGILNEIR
jgi:hypothetical protein